MENKDIITAKRADSLTLQQAIAISNKLKLSEDEIKNIYYIIGRDPTLAELGVYSAMWSEHCSYKSSKVHLKRLPSSAPDVVMGPGENAGIVRLKDNICLAFKMESHNHPSFIDPYQGAATGVGGILRDIFCMGARPIALSNCLRFGSKDHPKTSWLFSGVVKGIGDYGNCVGIPTVNGNVAFHPSYNGNILVNAMAVGIIKEESIFTGKAAGIGNLVIYVGSPTGRDGVHGATMASSSFASQEAGERGAIQVGDPFSEKLLMEATLEALAKGLVVGLQDMGAAGLTSSLVEMASRAGNGLHIDLDQVPQRAKDLTAYELMLSESQERMVMVCKPFDWPKLQEILEKWQLAYAIIGRVVEGKRFQAVFKDFLEIDLEVDPLCDGAPKLNRAMDFSSYTLDENYEDLTCSFTQEMDRFDYDTLAITALKTSGYPKEIYEQYDYHIGTRTCLGPTDQGAAVLKIFDDPCEYTGVAIATSGCHSYCIIDAFKGAELTVAKAARALFAVGGRPIGMTDCLNFGNPEHPKVMASFSQAIDGMAKACAELKIAAVSGNVSLYNETDGHSIAPTPMIGMVARVDDVTLSQPAIAIESGDLWLISPKNKDTLGWGGSLFLSEIGSGFDNIKVKLANIDWQAEKECQKFILQLLQKKKLTAIRDIGEGGVLTTCLKMILPTAFGAELKGDRDSLFWWGERTGSYLFVTAEELDFGDRLSFVDVTKIGKISCEKHLKINQTILDRERLEKTFKNALKL